MTRITSSRSKSAKRHKGATSRGRAGRKSSSSHRGASSGSEMSGGMNNERGMSENERQNY